MWTTGFHSLEKSMYLTCIYHFSLNVPVERMFENKLKINLQKWLCFTTKLFLCTWHNTNFIIYKFDIITVLRII